MKNIDKILDNIYIYMLFLTLFLMGFTTSILLTALYEIGQDETVPEDEIAFIIILIAVTLGLIMYLSVTIPQEIKRKYSVLKP